MREVLCNLVSCRSAHFASNLGVVELCIALHQTFDFLYDRLIWDTGHQIYPHKLLTGRYPQFHSMRTKGGLMGYPNPDESEYDLFMTGHAGSSVSTAIGLASGDALARPEDERWKRGGDRRRGISFGNRLRGDEQCRAVWSPAACRFERQQDVDLPRVGGMADYLDRLRMNRMYFGLKEEVVKVLGKVPLLGDPVERFLAQPEGSSEGGFAWRDVF